MNNNLLLSRDKFRENVFKRDNHKCVICKNAAKNTHHIMEERLFNDGGYYLDNGASLCEKHHIEAEQTTLSCEKIRIAAGITNIIIPDHLYEDYNYDKWGNIILTNGQRIKGELFYDESVQKILKQSQVLDLFQKYVKYQRTYHLPYSTLSKNDRKLKDDSNFIGKKVVVTLKMDGENTSLYNDYIHARTLDFKSHKTRHWIKGLWAKIAYLIDDNMRICGENLYAAHTIKYENLNSYFMVFSIWIDNTCLSWKETIEYAKILNLDIVPVIYEGIYDKEKIINSFSKYKNSHEGYVVRLAEEFTYGQFRTSIAKYVNPDFKQKINNSHGNWTSKKIETNKLKINSN